MERVIAEKVDYFVVLFRAIDDLRMLWNSYHIDYDRLGRALDFIEILADPLLTDKDRKEYLEIKSKLLNRKRVLTRAEYYDLCRKLLKIILNKLKTQGVLFSERADFVAGDED